MRALAHARMNDLARDGMKQALSYNIFLYFCTLFNNLYG